MTLRYEDAEAELHKAMGKPIGGPTPELVIALMHVRALEDQTAAIREGTLANERVHERVMNTMSRPQGSA